MNHRIGYVVIGYLLALSGCAQQQFGGRPCAQFLEFGPSTALDYPIPGATGVPDNVGTLIFSGTAPQKIELMPMVTGATPIATEATSVPSPLPSPISTPIGTTYGYYAVSIPALSRATTYQAQGLTEATSGCGGTGMQYAGGGSFMTQ